MRRLTRALISASVTFTIGVLVANFWSSIFPRNISLCTLARNPGAYHGKLIRVEAPAAIISSSILSDNFIIIAEPGCSDPDGWASVELDSSIGLTPEVNEFVNSPTPEIRRARIVVEGRFDQRTSIGCFTPKFGIKAARVTKLSSVTHEPLPEKLSERQY